MSSRLLAIVFYSVAIPLAVLLVQGASDAAAQEAAVAGERRPSVVAGDRTREVLERLTFGLYRGAAKLRESREARLSALAESHRRVSLLAWSLVAVTAAFLLAAWRAIATSAGVERIRRRRGLALHLIGAAAIFLSVGAVAPILTVVAFQELALVGRVVFSYESKSLVGTVGTLATGGNWFTAALLALFSLVVPVGKLGLCTAAVGLEARGATGPIRMARALLHHLGRWSMTDVFVVAVLVAFLSAEKAEATEAYIGAGLYFFAGHTVLAILASVSAAAGEPQPARTRGRDGGA